MTNMDKLYEAVEARGPVCVGLDTDFSYLPEEFVRPELTAGENILRFNRAIIEATKAVSGCYKVQVAYYESLGLDGMRAYAETLKLHALRDDLLRCCQIGLESSAVVRAAGDRLECKHQRVCSRGCRRIIYGKSSGEQHHGGQQTAENAFCQLQNTIPFLTVAECGHSALPYYLYFTFRTRACQDE